ncbi:MAG: emp24/gp25L/p24 family protein [Asgard group archaeon]|nr:emp24/gp25L/p24 family protein [Asgard group archaeon]
MSKLSITQIISTLLALLHLTSALHFYVKTGETKCFFEELQEDTLVVGKIDAYEKQENGNEYFKNPNLKVQITVEVCIFGDTE